MGLKKKLKTTLVGASMLVAMSGCGTSSNSGNLVVSEGVEYEVTDYEKIVAPNNELAYKLLDEIQTDDDGNVFFSPTSLFMALAMVYNGADGDTKVEMAKAMQAEGIDAMDLNKANAALMTKLNKDSEDIQLRIANSIWLNEEYNFTKDFTQRTKDYFNAKTQRIDVTSNESVKKINGWVKEATNDKIDKMVESPLDEDLVAMLLNAIYFKGDWKHPFDKRDTEERVFHVNSRYQKVTPFMKLDRKLAYMANNEFQAVRLPYANGEMSMTVVLPNEHTNLEGFVEKLSAENWEMLLQTTFTMMEGKLLLPKFKLDYETGLNEALSALGMKQAFTKDADFTKMVEDGNVLISNVKQKTYLDVNEEGTEAAAVTGTEMGVTSAPPGDPFYMEVNRPFFLMIKDEETGAVLFVGYVTNPK